EAFALTWGDISSDCCRIVVNKSRNYYNILKGTKNGRKRVFPCQRGTKLQLLLLSLRPENPQPDDLLFRSKTGKRMNSDIMLDFWKEARSREGEKIYQRPGLVTRLASQGLIPY
ncbi:MAG: integrase, partial [Nostoc sp.]